MRILLVVHGLPPAAAGGTEIYVHDLAHRLKERRGDEVFILTRESCADRPEMSVRQECRDGLHLTHVNNTFQTCSSFEQTYRNEAIRQIGGRLLEEIRPDVAHIHHLTGLGTDLVTELSARTIPTVFTLNDYWLLCQRGQLLDVDLERCAGPYPLGCARCMHLPVAASPVGRAAEGLLRLRPHLPVAAREPLRRVAFAALANSRSAESASAPVEERLRHVRSICGLVDRFLAPSRTLRDRFLALGIHAERLFLAEQGIEHRPFRGLRPTRADRLRLGFVGSLIVSKAPHVLLEAVFDLPPESVSVQVYGAYAPYHGDDRYRGSLERLLSRPGVTHFGSVSHEHISVALASIDVLVVPSVWIENAPFVIREAFRAGVPVVASDLGGLAEMVTHERNGLLFPAGDVVALRKALRRLLEEQGLLGRLRQGIPPVKSMEQDAAGQRDARRHQHQLKEVEEEERDGNDAG